MQMEAPRDQTLAELLRPPLSGVTSSLVSNLLEKNGHLPQGLSDVAAQWLTQLPQEKQIAVLRELLGWQSSVENPSGALVYTIKKHGHNFTGLTSAIKQRFFSGSA
ncbi:hypothetical protein KFL_000040350 [Klebsormidium nitens]|uniref:Uncharacterized protein n=1 Tax=Klebsormidium nitens TaxID=105231 RepID=A0A1Y1HHB2_KLENI|nr:hypothetical protein KFL_000040350 [Klebsormidium nitens]|eukprot:GAQ77835.1 hypothetical protein KFL_000040350 [Klebsormidium nitens]